MTNSTTDGASPPAGQPQVTFTDPAIVKRAVGAAAIGNVTEWYDFGVFAYLTTTIDDVFYSGLPANLRVLATAATFAVSFVVRPLGGLFFGPLADKIGRNKVLSTTMLLMASSTFLIGCLPSFESIGLWSPILLILLRLLQGFSTGGEYGNAMTFIAEYAPDRRRGFMGSWLEFGTLTGYSMAAILFFILHTTLSTTGLDTIGWRAMFWVALPLGAVGVYLRLKLEDTPAFNAMVAEADAREKEQRSQKGEFKRIFVDNWPAMLICGALVATWNITNYMLTTYIPHYVTDDLKQQGQAVISSSGSEIAQIIVLLVGLVLVTFVGRIADRIGHKPIVVAGSLALIVLAFPSVLLIQAGSFFPVLIGLLIMALTLIMFSGNMPGLLPALFPTAVRAGALCISFNIFVAAFGGTTDAVMTGLVQGTHDVNWPAYYLIFAGILGLIAAFFLKETAGKPLMGSGPSAGSEQEARELTAAAARD